MRLTFDGGKAVKKIGRDKRMTLKVIHSRRMSDRQTRSLMLDKPSRIYMLYTKMDELFDEFHEKINTGSFFDFFHNVFGMPGLQIWIMNSIIRLFRQSRNK